MGKAQ